MTPPMRALVVSAKLGAAKETVHPTIDMDLAVSSLLDAIGMVGDEPYVLSVHPVAQGVAKNVICGAFPGPIGAAWRDRIAVITRTFRYTDEWSLENDTVRYHTFGV